MANVPAFQDPFEPDLSISSQVFFCPVDDVHIFLPPESIFPRRLHLIYNRRVTPHHVLEDREHPFEGGAFDPATSIPPSIASRFFPNLVSIYLDNCKPMQKNSTPYLKALASIFQERATSVKHLSMKSSLIVSCAQASLLTTILMSPGLTSVDLSGNCFGSFNFLRQPLKSNPALLFLKLNDVSTLAKDWGELFKSIHQGPYRRYLCINSNTISDNAINMLLGYLYSFHNLMGLSMKRLRIYTAKNKVHIMPQPTVPFAQVQAQIPAFDMLGCPEWADHSFFPMPLSDALTQFRADYESPHLRHLNMCSSLVPFITPFAPYAPIRLASLHIQYSQVDSPTMASKSVRNLETILQDLICLRLSTKDERPSSVLLPRISTLKVLILEISVARGSLLRLLAQSKGLKFFDITDTFISDERAPELLEAIPFHRGMYHVSFKDLYFADQFVDHLFLHWNNFQSLHTLQLSFIWLNPKRLAILLGLVFFSSSIKRLILSITGPAVQEDPLPGYIVSSLAQHNIPALCFGRDYQPAEPTGPGNMSDTDMVLAILRDGIAQNPFIELLGFYNLGVSYARTQRAIAEGLEFNTSLRWLSVMQPGGGPSQ
ncbi:hypothetical protein H696_04718 [Fonticula alba]|uniref:Uncharacterized protein n=1 Tax=Fonticula alba TaxID=691883 RepID=A0A058Z2D1_FONAL|nr:hypothetical protein H696_04718 [Fonticula alba]KCV68424.1 hypothetical protein H696_04718 [Fonticula alba]|eukprot:XP_009496856.1 hypothetical protein H696_04718 [Fonticula alba]